jgi:hypothetical protein
VITKHHLSVARHQYLVLELDSVSHCFFKVAVGVGTTHVSLEYVQLCFGVHVAAIHTTIAAAAVAAVVGIVVVPVNHHPAITPTAATERPRQQLASACTGLLTQQSENSTATTNKHVGRVL